MPQSLVMNYSSEYVATSHFHVCGCKNRLSAARWLRPLKISLSQRLAQETSDSESSLAKITLHKQRLQQIALVWITLHDMAAVHFWAFGLPVSRCF